MKPLYYIPAKFLPQRPPVAATALWITVLHHWGAPDWLYGVVGVFIVFLWTSFIIFAVEGKPMKCPPFNE